MKNRKLLILGPSFRRRKEKELSAIERYDGLFFRIAKKYLASSHNIDVLVMKDDLLLAKGDASAEYTPPVGNKWGVITLNQREIENARQVNVSFVRKMKTKKYSEVFVVAGKRYYCALPEQPEFETLVTFAQGSGLGSKARSLVVWFMSNMPKD